MPAQKGATHPSERCPAQDPYTGAMLLNHLSRSNLRQHGIEIQGEAVVQGEHTLYLIMEAADEGCLYLKWRAVWIFMRPRPVLVLLRAADVPRPCP
jgi:hypothetical protein